MADVKGLEPIIEKLDAPATPEFHPQPVAPEIPATAEAPAQELLPAMVIAPDGKWGIYAFDDLENTLPAEVPKGTQVENFTVSRAELLQAKPELASRIASNIEHVRAWRIKEVEKQVVEHPIAPLAPKPPMKAEVLGVPVAAAKAEVADKIVGAEKEGVPLESVIAEISAARSGSNPDWSAIAGSAADSIEQHQRQI